MGALTTNVRGNGTHAIDNNALAEYIIRLQAQVYQLANKLDADGGVTATDFTADIEKIMASGAAPIGTQHNITALIALANA